jgi:hypothetical protein
MTVLSCLQRVATVIGLDVPTTVYGSTDREYVELADVANDVAETMARHYDWQKLKTIATLTGDGATEDYSIPSDYGRQLVKATLWVTSRPFYPLEHVADTDRWLGIVTSDIQVSIGQWTIYGDEIHVRPAMATGDDAKYYYITKNIVQPATGSNKELFTLDTDTFLLDDRVLRYGVIWQWKANKGLPYAEDMQTYEIALAEAVARDKGSKVMIVGQQRLNGGTAAEFAWPGMLG